MVHGTMGGNTKTKFPLSRLDSIHKRGNREKGGGEEVINIVIVTNFMFMV
jgi:hypothetical protein